MKNYTTLAGAAKARLKKYVENICRGVGRPETRLVADILFGVSRSNDCKLTQIARALEETISVKKTVERLRRGLRDFENTQTLQDNYLDLANKHIDNTTIFAIDGSDIAKPCSTAMEALHTVRDGSTGKYVPGYMTMECVAMTRAHKIPIPVYERVFSAAEPGFVSEDNEVLTLLRFISNRFGHGGVRVIDRGFDANVYLKYFVENKEHFVLRVKNNRMVHYKGSSINIGELAGRFKGKIAMTCTLQGKSIRLKMTAVPITLPAFGQTPFNLVVIHGFGEKPMLLLTNCDNPDTRLAGAIARVYLLRWRIEDTFRFQKQQYNFEDFRVRSLNAIRTLHTLVSLLTGFLALLSHNMDDAFQLELCRAAKHIPKKKQSFFHYLLADGFRRALLYITCGIRHLFPPLRLRPHSVQLSFFELYPLFRPVGV